MSVYEVYVVFATNKGRLVPRKCHSWVVQCKPHPSSEIGIVTLHRYYVDAVLVGCDCYNVIGQQLTTSCFPYLIITKEINI